MKTIGTSLALAFALLLAPPAARAAAADAPSASVAFGDLDLASPAGRATLHQRLHLAAKEVCGDSLAMRSLAERRQAKACQADAIAAVLPTLQQAVAAAESARRMASASPMMTPGH